MIKVNVMSGKSVWEIFCDECKGVADAYIKLSEEINIDGVLDKKTLNLILVGIFSTTHDPVALRAFVRDAFNAGATKKEIESAALLAFKAGVTSAEMSIPIILEVEKER
jgi:alkylhydroperoxidase/carboxymuconolactone decarboxylase family protein YurZ